MKRFTVSLEDEVYDRLKEEGRSRQPPAALQQMVRLAVGELLGTEAAPAVDVDAPVERSLTPADVLVFRLGHVEAACRVAAVAAVESMPRVFRVPGAPAAVWGLAVLRERLVPVIDLAERMRLPPLEPDGGYELVVVEKGEEVEAWAVDRVEGMLPAGEGEWSRLPPSVSAHSLVAGMIRSGDRVLTLLEP